jgi:superoxide dismutase
MIDIGRVNGYDPLFRMTGPDDVINTFAARALPAQHFHTKKYHLDRCNVAHAYMSAEEVQEARKHVLIEEVGNIVSSRKASHPTRQQPEPSLPPTSRTQAATRSVNTALSLPFSSAPVWNEEAALVTVIAAGEGGTRLVKMPDGNATLLPLKDARVITTSSFTKRAQSTFPSTCKTTQSTGNPAD